MRLSTINKYNASTHILRKLFLYPYWRLKMSEKRKLRWLIAHYPKHLFQRTADAFTQELNQLLPDQFEVEVHTADTYVKQYGKLNNLLLKRANLPGLEEELSAEDNIGASSDTSTKWNTLFDGLRDGDIEITQTQVHIAGELLDSGYQALDLPYLFNDHDHVSRVLDGAIGDALCVDHSEKTGIRGLAFTYSGGYRVIGSNKSITNLSALVDTNLVTGSTPSWVLFRELGITNTFNLGDVSDLGESVNLEAVETTYIRFSGKNVLRTNHSMFLTTILTGNKFWNTLTPEQQDAFKIATKKVAKLERQWSIADAAEYEQKAVDNGVTIVDLSAEDTASLKKVAQKSYIHMNDIGVDRKLVASIIKEGRGTITVH